MVVHSPRPCKWHECGRSFVPVRQDNEFCSTQCRIDRATWRRTRGSVLVDPLIAGDWETLQQLREAIIKETGNDQ